MAWRKKSFFVKVIPHRPPIKKSKKVKKKSLNLWFIRYKLACISGL